MPERSGERLLFVSRRLFARFCLGPVAALLLLLALGDYLSARAGVSKG